MPLNLAIQWPSVTLTRDTASEGDMGLTPGGVGLGVNMRRRVGDSEYEPSLEEFCSTSPWFCNADINTFVLYARKQMLRESENFIKPHLVSGQARIQFQVVRTRK